MNQLRTIAVIPARLASTRFPEKVIAELGGKPIIQWVWERTVRSRADRVLVATDSEKVFLDCGGHPNIGRCLSAVFDSQIVGGKNYDLAAEGRRLANATFSASHACDTYTGLNYAMDLTPLMLDKDLKIAEYVTGYIRRFEQEVRQTLAKFTEE